MMPASVATVMAGPTDAVATSHGRTRSAVPAGLLASGATIAAYASVRPSGEMSGPAAGSPSASVLIAAPVVPSRSVSSPVAVHDVSSWPLGSNVPVFHGE